MNTTQSLTIDSLSSSVSACEAYGLGLCFQAYANECAGDEIMQIGFNPNSGYVYIALENGVSICSMLGREVEFLVTDFNDGHEYFFDSYRDAETFSPCEEAE